MAAMPPKAGDSKPALRAVMPPRAIDRQHRGLGDEGGAHRRQCFRIRMTGGGKDRRQEYRIQMARPDQRPQRMGRRCDDPVRKSCAPVRGFAHAHLRQMQARGPRYPPPAPDRRLSAAAPRRAVFPPAPAAPWCCGRVRSPRCRAAGGAPLLPSPRRGHRSSAPAAGPH